VVGGAPYRFLILARVFLAVLGLEPPHYLILFADENSATTLSTR
jgi:hypothetical protein